MFYFNKTRVPEYFMEKAFKGSFLLSDKGLCNESHTVLSEKEQQGKEAEA